MFLLPRGVSLMKMLLLSAALLFIVTTTSALKIDKFVNNFGAMVEVGVQMPEVSYGKYFIYQFEPGGSRENIVGGGDGYISAGGVKTPLKEAHYSEIIVDHRGRVIVPMPTRES